MLSSIIALTATLALTTWVLICLSWLKHKLLEKKKSTSSLRTKRDHLLLCHISPNFVCQQIFRFITILRTIKKQKSAANYILTPCLLITWNFYFMLSEWILRNLERVSISFITSVHITCICLWNKLVKALTLPLWLVAVQQQLEETLIVTTIPVLKMLKNEKKKKVSYPPSQCMGLGFDPWSGK